MQALDRALQRTRSTDADMAAMQRWAQYTRTQVTDRMGPSPELGEAASTGPHTGGYPSTADIVRGMIGQVPQRKENGQPTAAQTLTKAHVGRP